MKKIILTIFFNILFLSFTSFVFAQEFDENGNFIEGSMGGEQTQNTDPQVEIMEEINSAEIDSATGLKKPVLQITIPDLSFSGDKGLWIGEYIRAVYNYAIGIVGILAAVVLMWGGLLWLTAGGDQGKVTEAKAWIAASLTGLVIALSSWTILYVINPDLVAFNALKINDIEKVELENNQHICTWKRAAVATAKTCPAGEHIGNDCNPEKQPKKTVGVGSGGYGTTYQTIDDDYICCCPSLGEDIKMLGPLANGELNNDQARGMLNDNIQIKTGVNLYGIKEGTIIGLNEMTDLFELQPGDVVITSGTNGEHVTGEYSHANGYKVDLRYDNDLGNAIRNEYPRTTGNVEGYDAYYINFTSDSDGARRYYRFLDEGDHWDVRITRTDVRP